MSRKRKITDRPVCSVHMSTQSDHDRLAMIIMQLDIALAFARQQHLHEVERHLEAALAKACLSRDSYLH